MPVRLDLARLLRAAARVLGPEEDHHSYGLLSRMAESAEESQALRDEAADILIDPDGTMAFILITVRAFREVDDCTEADVRVDCDVPGLLWPHVNGALQQLLTNHG